MRIGAGERPPAVQETATLVKPLIQLVLEQQQWKRAYATVTFDSALENYVQVVVLPDDASRGVTLQLEFRAAAMWESFGIPQARWEKRMQRLQWQLPRTDPDAHIPNWWRRATIATDGELGEVAEAVARTMHTAYGFRAHRDHLVVEIAEATGEV
jgi:hypothetical protein